MTIYIYTLQGIIHPNMKMLSSFTHPHAVPNLYKFISYTERRRRYSEECWTSIVGSEILHKSIETVNCVITKFFKIYYFMFNMRKKLIQVWNDMKIMTCTFWIFCFASQEYIYFKIYTNRTVLLYCPDISEYYWD